MSNRLTGPPVFLLAFANDRDDGAKYLRNLPDELREIKAALDQAKSQGLCDYVYLANATLTEILDTFTRSEYRNRIAAFHYAGHANSFQLMLETKDGRVARADAAGLAAFLSRQLGLQLVFLNGCSTQQQVEALLDANIPMVIATSQAIKDEVAKEFATRFYRGLAGGINVRAAYREAEATVRAQGDGNMRNLYSVGDQIQEDRWPWNLNFKKGVETAGDWNLPEAAENPLFGLPGIPSGDLPADPFRHLSWFTRKEAEVFFGRNYEIRQLYDRITEATAAPLVLLYGQTGVGKSSLLDAGITPRLENSHHVLYCRRDQQLGLLGTTAQALGFSKEHPLKLASAWRDLEQQYAKPLLLILDQIEEVFTQPSGTPEAELEDFLKAVVETFAVPAQRPQGRLILGFRKEWYSEIEQKLKDHNLPRATVFLAQLDRRAIIQAVVGVTSSPRLQQHYRIRIEEQLPEIIAVDLSSDPNSPIAPTLQILLTKLWAEAKKRNNTAPAFDLDLYLELKKKGILLGDFLNQQIAQLQESEPEAVNSGLVLDVLAFHLTALGTSKKRTEDEVKAEYEHRLDSLPQLIERLKALYLLAEPPPDQVDTNEAKATRLSHDTLGPLIRDKFSQSVQPGQRARRILENRMREWREDDEGTLLQENDLAIVELGKAGMRNWRSSEKNSEEDLIAASRKARDEKARQLKIRRLVRFPLFGALGAGLGVGLVRVLMPIQVSGTEALFNLFIAGVLGAALSFGIALANSLQSKPLTELSNRIRSPSALRNVWLSVSLGTMLFGLTHLIIILILAVSYTRSLYYVVLMGFALGFGLSLALSLPMRGGKLSKVLTVTLRLTIAATTFVLVNEFFLFASDDDEMAVLQTLITVGSSFLKESVDQLPDRQLPLPMWITLINRYFTGFKIMAAIHGAMTGIFMTAGLTLALQQADSNDSLLSKFVDTWKRIFGPQVLNSP